MSPGSQIVGPVQPLLTFVGVQKESPHFASVVLRQDSKKLGNAWASGMGKLRQEN